MRMHFKVEYEREQQLQGGVFLKQRCVSVYYVWFWPWAWAVFAYMTLAQESNTTGWQLDGSTIYHTEIYDLGKNKYGNYVYWGQY